MERFGKFARVAGPGPLTLNVACGVPTETLRARVDLRVCQQVVKCEAKTRDNVFCTVEVRFPTPASFKRNFERPHDIPLRR